MIWIVVGIVIAVVLVITALAVLLLFYFGLVSCYHPIKAAKEGQVKVACIGDSITYGCMLRNRGKNNYPKILGELLGEDYCVNNFGYTNRTAIKSADYPYVNEKLYKQSLDFNPDIAIILLGTNDSKENNWDEDKFVCDYCEIIDSYMELNPSLKVYLLIPPPAFKVGKKVLYNLRKDVIDNEICPAVKRIADMKGIDYVDIHEIFENKKEFFADGVHPNQKGSALLAQTLYDRLKGVD